MQCGRREAGQKQDPSVGWKTAMKNLAVGANDGFAAKERHAQICIP